MLWSVLISFGVSAVISFVVFLSIFYIVIIQKNKKQITGSSKAPRDLDPAATEKMLQTRDPVHHEVDPRSHAHQPEPEESLLPSAPPAEEVFYPNSAKIDDLYPKLNGLELEKGA